MAQSFSNLLIHLVFSTKYRNPVINQDMEPELYIVMKGIARNMNTHAIEIGGTEDHVHILLVLPRTGIISDTVRNIKSYSSRWVKEKDPAQSNFSWQRGYAAFSVSYSSRNKVIEYIRMQKKIHENRSFQDEYRLILKMHEIHFDEKQIWA